MFEGKPIELTEANFDRHLSRSGLPLVVDFWAPWCGPCIAMAPFYEAAARQLEPNFRFAKLNTQDEPAPAGRFGIRSIPTLIVFRVGKEIARRSGAMDAATLTGWLSSVG
jgi:thioredoxin 2